ncbi:MAG: hypothetical protein Q7S89_03315 [bacterium]|nr:hypothetical protein [bacterium]
MTPLVPLDIFAAKAYGLKQWQDEFSWPVSDQEFVGLCDAIEGVIAAHINAAPSLVSDALLVKRNLPFEYWHFLHALWVLERIRGSGAEPLASKHSLWYGALLDGTYLKTNYSLSGKRSVIWHHPPSLRSALVTRSRAFVDTLRLNAVPRKVFSRMSGQYGSVFGRPDELSKSYVAQLPYWVSVQHEHDWLGDMRTVSLSDTERAILGEVAHAITSELQRIAAGYAISLNAGHLSYLERFTEGQLCDAAVALASFRTVSSVRRSHPFFAPVLHAPIQRVIAIGVREAGGAVTSFAHGGVVGLFNSPTSALNEFALADEFVTYTKGSVSLFEKILASRPALRGNTVQILSANSDQYLRLHTMFAATPPPPKVRRVMVVAFPHAPWRKPQGSGVFSPMHLDLELRLVRQLCVAGFEVVYKAHPDRLREIEGIFDDGVTVLTEDFQHVQDHADAYVFGSIRTTAFPIALCTNKPIVGIIMNPEHPVPFSEALVLLEKRCAMVRSTFDERNRINVDVERIAEILKQTPEKPNTEFLEQYYFPSKD